MNGVSAVVRMIFIAFFAAILVMMIHTQILRSEDKALADAIVKHFDFHDQRVERLEKRVEQLEQQAKHTQ